MLFTDLNEFRARHPIGCRVLNGPRPRRGAPTNPSGGSPVTTVDTPTRRGRGRPQKQKLPKRAFDAQLHTDTVAAIKAIPPGKRNAVRDSAIAAASRDLTMRGSHKAIFARLASETWWKDGACLRSNAWLARECGTSKRNVELAMGAFRDAGWTSRKERKNAGGDYRTAETTIPLFAQVWAEMQKWVPSEYSEGTEQKFGGVPNNNSVGTELECGQPSDSPPKKKR